jgi:hypothetical protein
MASLATRDKNGKRVVVSGLDLIRDGSMVGADIGEDDVEDIVAEIEAAKSRAEKTTAKAADVDPDDWPLKSVTPANYLKKTPKGPQAKLAQLMVDAGHGDVLAGDDEDDEEDDGDDEG